jgi:signal transduction histidine kinase
VRYERRIVLTAVLALAPVALAALVLVFTGDFSTKAKWTVIVAIAIAIFIAIYILHEQLVFPLRTISNIITALREEDYSLRARNARRDDALGEVMVEVNALAALMESRKLEAVEATALLRAVLAQIDADAKAFDVVELAYDRWGSTQLAQDLADAARLPEPRKRDVRVDALVRRVAALETRVPVNIDGVDATIRADEDQLEQMLINLVKNAADAAKSSVAIRWRANGDFILTIEDDGPGISGTTNLFVPFFTTKPNGSGIGLFLSRQIAEAHGGSLTLANRVDASGAVATLTLPHRP